MLETILVAGIGNIFMGDDAFGSEVAQRLARMPLPAGVKVSDFGIRGIHLAYELLDHPYPLTILVDITPRGGTPGTIYLIEPSFEELKNSKPAAPDAHSMTPDAVFATLFSLGGTPGRVLIVGCEPENLEDMGLSETVENAVDEALRLIHDVLAKEGRDARIWAV